MTVYLWKLAYAKHKDDPDSNKNSLDDKGQKMTNPVWRYSLKNVDFKCVKTYREIGNENPFFFITGSDKTLREFGGPENKIKEKFRLE